MTENADSSVAEAFVDESVRFLTTDYLPKIEKCLELLTDEQLLWRANPESNSIANLILHLCGNARQWIVSGLGGEIDARDRDQEFVAPERASRRELVELLHTTLGDVKLALKRLDKSTLLQTRPIQGNEVTGLYAIFHVTEHFGMHTGQIILLTKQLTQSELAFYDFSTGKPVTTWRK